MANPILIIGESGTGKSTSLKNLDPNTTFIINPYGKSLPWKGSASQYIEGKNMFTPKNDRTCMAEVTKKLEEVNKDTRIKTLVTEDMQWLMAFEFMSRSKEKGFEKFSDIASGMFEFIKQLKACRNDLNIILLSHLEPSTELGGKSKAKTVGRAIDQYFTLESLFTIVLLADSRRKGSAVEYLFKTNDPGSTSKSPEGMLPAEMSNDIKLVIEKVTEYYK